MECVTEVWKGDQRFSIKVDRKDDKAWVEYPSGVSKEIGLVTADALIQLNGMRQITE